MTSFSSFINQSVFSLSVGKSYLKAGSLQSLSVQMSSLVSALRIIQRMAEEQPVTLPEATVDLGEDKKRKRKAPKKVSEAVKKRKNLTLELPKPEGTVRFDEIVLVKVGQRQTMVLLKGYSSPNSAFYKKCQLQKLNMHLKHLDRTMMPR